MANFVKSLFPECTHLQKLYSVLDTARVRVLKKRGYEAPILAWKGAEKRKEFTAILIHPARFAKCHSADMKTCPAKGKL